VTKSRSHNISIRQMPGNSAAARARARTHARMIAQLCALAMCMHKECSRTPRIASTHNRCPWSRSCVCVHMYLCTFAFFFPSLPLSVSLFIYICAYSCSPCFSPCFSLSLSLSPSLSRSGTIGGPLEAQLDSPQLPGDTQVTKMF
jgi:hypothetical protein